jgi:hypothetical protein
MMMDCRQVKKLLPLWIGQDLPDAAIASNVANHLENCPECERRRIGLQASLEALQGSAEIVSVESTRQSVWPGLVSRISDWENVSRRERFNGWIPASVMALAVALMIGVSIPSIHDVFFGGQIRSASNEDLFGSDVELRMNSQLDANQRSKPATPNGRAAQGTPVNFKPDQW